MTTGAACLAAATTATPETCRAHGTRWNAPFESPKREELYSKIRAFLRIKDLQDRLKGESDKLNQIFRFLHEPVAICSSDDRVLLASQVFLSLMRMPREVASFKSMKPACCKPMRSLGPRKRRSSSAMRKPSLLCSIMASRCLVSRPPPSYISRQ